MNCLPYSAARWPVKHLINVRVSQICTCQSVINIYEYEPIGRGPAKANDKVIRTIKEKAAADEAKW